MAELKVFSEFSPAGDQPQAIRELSDGLMNGRDYQTLLGITGSGKTFTIDAAAGGKNASGPALTS